VILFAPTIGFAGLSSFSVPMGLGGTGPGLWGVWTGTVQPGGMLAKVPQKNLARGIGGGNDARGQVLLLSHAQLLVLPDGREGRADYNRF
jgi:hypothetical protein